MATSRCQDIIKLEFNEGRFYYDYRIGMRAKGRLSKRNKKRGTTKRRMRGGSAPPGKVYVFYHIYCNDNTPSIVKDQCMRIIFSRLYARADKIYCFLAGEQAKIDEMERMINNYGSKFVIAKKGPGDTSYERFTLFEIPKYVKPEDKFLYIHSKGAKSTNAEDIFWWRTWLEYGVMARHEECLAKLDEYDVVGVNYSEKLIGKHFSGNFWWATGKYYLTLPNEISNSGPKPYYEPERYVLTGKGVKYHDIEAGRLPENQGLYGTNFYPSKYVDFNSGS